MPGRLPLPIPELAFLVRFVIERLGIPSSPRRDYIINYLRHVSVVRRLPARHMMFNDVMFHIKTSAVLRNTFSRMVTDKELSKIHIGRTVGEKYVIPTLAILTSVEDIDAFEFPESCIIKPTHASGQCIARLSGETLDIDRIKRWLNLNYYDKTYEANYQHLVPKIIVEPWVFGKKETREFKIYCVNGKAKAIDALSDRLKRFTAGTFDVSWNNAAFKSIYKKATSGTFKKPALLDEMIQVSERLSRDFFFVRIDLYSDGELVKCGEITNCPAAGLETYKPPSDELLQSQLLFADLTPEMCENSFNRITS